MIKECPRFLPSRLKLRTLARYHVILARVRLFYKHTENADPRRCHVTNCISVLTKPKTTIENRQKKDSFICKTAYKPIILFQAVVHSCVEVMETTKMENANVTLDGKAKNVV